MQSKYFRRELTAYVFLLSCIPNTGNLKQPYIIRKLFPAKECSLPLLIRVLAYHFRKH